jgi:peptide/nickel transport system substrate-binding protein
MALRRKSVTLIALLLVLSLIAAACGGDDEAGGGVQGTEGEESQLEPVEGGTLVFGAEQEPSEGLNHTLACCTLFWATLILNRVLLGAYEPNPDFEYEPSELLAGEAEITEDPFTVTYNVNPEAEWSDGTPITADDFLFTAETYVNPKWAISSRAGFDQIDFKKTEVVDDKTVTFAFKEPVAAWRELFGVTSPLLPKHALEGENFNKVWTNEIVNPKTGEPIASGPFQFAEYNKGSDLTIERNENWYGDHPAYLDAIRFQFVPDTSSEIQALRGGEVQAIYPQPQLELTQLQGVEGLEIQTNAGTTWEHLDFQYSHPLLGQDFVRQALGRSIDREAMIQTLFKDIEPTLEPLQNMIFLNGFPGYEPHFQDYTYDPDQARQILEDNGCTEGDDGIYECDGERMSFGIKSTTGNRLRELTFEILQEQAREAGIEFKAEFGDAAVVFGNQGLAGEKYDIFMFAWVGNPDPSGSVEIHKCNGGQNYQNYCNKEASRLLDESDTLVDPQERIDAMNEADALMAEDLPILPLYQKPTFFAFSSELQNGIDNATQMGPTWNAEDWFLSEEGAQQ